MAQSERVAQLLESLQVAHRDRGKSALALARASAVDVPAVDDGDVKDGRTSLPPLLRETLLMPGTVVELVGAPGRGATSLALLCLAEALAARLQAASASTSTASMSTTAAQTWLCAIDPERTLFGPAVHAMGVPLSRLLVVVPGADDVTATRKTIARGASLWRSAVRAIKSGVFCGAVVDACAVDVDNAAFVAVRRLGLAAEECGASVFVLTDERAARQQPLPSAARAIVGEGGVVVERHRTGKTSAFLWEPPRSPLARFWGDPSDHDVTHREKSAEKA